jgi:hypothetical protein
MIHSHIHRVVSLKAKSAPLLGGALSRWTTDVIAHTEDGNEITLTFFSDGPLEIQGAEFVNHVASGQTEPA